MPKKIIDIQTSHPMRYAKKKNRSENMFLEKKLESVAKDAKLLATKITNAMGRIKEEVHQMEAQKKAYENERYVFDVEFGYPAKPTRMRDRAIEEQMKTKLAEHRKRRYENEVSRGWDKWRQNPTTRKAVRNLRRKERQRLEALRGQQPVDVSSDAKSADVVKQQIKQLEKKRNDQQLPRICESLPDINVLKKLPKVDKKQTLMHGLDTKGRTPFMEGDVDKYQRRRAGSLISPSVRKLTDEAMQMKQRDEERREHHARAVVGRMFGDSYQMAEKLGDAEAEEVVHLVVKQWLRKSGLLYNQVTFQHLQNLKNFIIRQKGEDTSLVANLKRILKEGRLMRDLRESVRKKTYSGRASDKAEQLAEQQATKLEEMKQGTTTQEAVLASIKSQFENKEDLLQDLNEVVSRYKQTVVKHKDVYLPEEALATGWLRLPARVVSQLRAQCRSRGVTPDEYIYMRQSQAANQMIQYQAAQMGMLRAVAQKPIMQHRHSLESEQSEGSGVAYGQKTSETGVKVTGEKGKTVAFMQGTKLR